MRDLYRDLLDSLGAIVWESEPEVGQFVGLDAVHADDRRRVQAACARAIETCAGNRLDYRVVSVDGRARVIRNAFRVVGENGRARRLVGALLDVTEWADAGPGREDIYQATFDEALIGLAQTSLDGRYLLVNRRLSELLGYTADELTSVDFMTLSHPDEVEQDTRAKDRLIAGGIDRYTREKRYRRKDGSFVWTNLTVSLHRDARGEPSYFIATIEDITERKRAEEEARQLHKMEAIGRLAGSIAHDFNNLLTAMVGYADLALIQLRRDDPVSRDIQEIRVAGKSAASLTRQLLAFSRKQILQPEVLDLNVIVSRLHGLLRRLIGEHIRLEWRLTRPLDRVSADPGQVEQVVLNLALNARDAMPRGG
ncbi:MAG TPA: PAS domain S-box protein, partial [Vicinamibacterales bacterium]|nr:PAS domain S-box protein [Vicinamibacterales bacterium]